MLKDPSSSLHFHYVVGRYYMEIELSHPRMMKRCGQKKKKKKKKAVIPKREGKERSTRINFVHMLNLLGQALMANTTVG